MPQQDWIRANLFAIVMQACYYMGALHLAADYVHRETGTSYRSFFEGMITFLLRRDCPTGAVLRRFRDLFAAFADGKMPLYDYQPDCGDMTWFAEEGLFLEIAKAPTVFYEDVLAYAAQVIPSDIAEELLRYQALMLFTPSKSEEPVRFRWDFDAYFSNPQNTPENRPISVSVRQNATYGSLPEYAREIVWYKRKFGGTICNTDNSDITVQRIG